MGSSEKTKTLLANELKRKAHTLPLSKIRVVDLCAACGIDRRTFYYHFRDVYDLTAWTFNHAVDEFHPGIDIVPGTKGIEIILTKLREDAVFYRCALSEDSQNALGRHMLAHDIQIYENALKNRFSLETLSEEDAFAIRHYCFGCLGMIRRWLFNDCTPPPAKMASLLISVMPPAIQNIFQKEQP